MLVTILAKNIKKEKVVARNEQPIRIEYLRPIHSPNSRPERKWLIHGLAFFQGFYYDKPKMGAREQNKLNLGHFWKPSQKNILDRKCLNMFQREKKRLLSVETLS